MTDANSFTLDSSLTLGLICTSILLFISEILPYLPTKAKGIVKGLEIATVKTLNSFHIPATLPEDISKV
jgi:hypothetical protein